MILLFLERERDWVTIRSSKVLFGRIKGCLLYEIVKHEDHQTPLIWGSRIFLVIDVSISPHQIDERKVAVKLISVKSNEFKVTKKDVKDLYKNVLRHFMHDSDQDSQWNLEKLGLNLEVYFDRKAQAELYVHLSRAEELPKDIPVFHSYGDFM
jgi:hypothetical protein